MNITILNVTVSTQPTKTGKTYQVADVAYKNNTFQGKVEGKKLMSFGAQADTFKTLVTAQSGQSFEVDVVKNSAGYNDWIVARPVEGAPTQGSINNAPAAAIGKASGASNAPRSTYETPEERAQKQVYIIRQSSISSAIATLSVGSKSAPKVNEILEVAKRYEDYVFGKKDVALTGGATGFDDIPDFDHPDFDPKVD